MCPNTIPSDAKLSVDVYHPLRLWGKQSWWSVKWLYATVEKSWVTLFGSLHVKSGLRSEGLGWWPRLGNSFEWRRIAVSIIIKSSTRHWSLIQRACFPLNPSWLEFLRRKFSSWFLGLLTTYRVEASPTGRRNFHFFLYTKLPCIAIKAMKSGLGPSPQVSPPAHARASTRLWMRGAVMRKKALTGWRTDIFFKGKSAP